MCKNVKQVLIEQFTEDDYTMEELSNIFMEKMATARKCGHSIAFITQEPVFDKDGNITGVRLVHPAKIRIYKLVQEESNHGRS